MNTSAVLLDGYSRVRERVQHVLDGLSQDEVGARLDNEANSIAWLIWHLSRVQDDHVAEAFAMEQVWTMDHFFERFGLPFQVSASGYGQRSEEVAALSAVPAELLWQYYAAVHERTVVRLKDLGDEAFDRIVDKFDGADISLGVRLVSVLDDDLEHVGQAAFIRGILERSR